MKNQRGIGIDFLKKEERRNRSRGGQLPIKIV